MRNKTILLIRLRTDTRRNRNSLVSDTSCGRNVNKIFEKLKKLKKGPGNDEKRKHNSLHENSEASTCHCEKCDVNFSATQNRGETQQFAQIFQTKFRAFYNLRTFFAAFFFFHQTITRSA